MGEARRSTTPRALSFSIVNGDPCAPRRNGLLFDAPPSLSTVAGSEPVASAGLGVRALRMELRAVERLLLPPPLRCRALRLLCRLEDAPPEEEGGLVFISRGAARTGRWSRSTGSHDSSSTGLAAGPGPQSGLRRRVPAETGGSVGENCGSCFLLKLPMPSSMRSLSVQARACGFVGCIFLRPVWPKPSLKERSCGLTCDRLTPKSLHA